MKTLYIILSALLITTCIYAQSPEKMSYQAVVRNSSDQLVSNQQVGMQISILQGSSDGTPVYIETQTPTTNANGLVSIEIGGNNVTVVSGDFSIINWATGTFFIKTETDPSGGTDYTITGTSQLLSVPYALHSKTADTVTGKIFFAEEDPVFEASVASEVTPADTVKWNNKSEFDGDFSSLYNAPQIANSINEKTIQLNSGNNKSSLNIINNDKKSVFKVDGSGRITGDGSALSNVKPLINYIGGDQRYQITANYGSYNNVRSVTLTVPTDGVCFVMASGYVDWESIGWDLLLTGILCDQDPNISWAAEDEWYRYLNILTDYNCPDSSDQYTSFSQHRSIPVNAGTHTFYLWANKHSFASKTEVADVNLTVMFFPTGGIVRTTKDAIIREERDINKQRIPNTVAGYK